MECAICYGEITKSKIELSCSHRFHIKCLTTWFKSQSEQHINQTCPCCRHEVEDVEEVPMVDKTEHERFRDLFKVYEDQVTTWHINTSNKLVSLRQGFDYMNEWGMAQEAEANKNLLRAEAAETRCRQLELEKAKSLSVNKWAKWSATERKG